MRILTTIFLICVGGSSKGDLLGEQNETGLKREFSQDVGPAILWGFGWLGDDPELAMGMVDESHGMARGGTDRPTTAEEINLVVGVDASGEVQRQMEVQQAGVRTRAQYDALFFLSLGTGVVRGEAGGAADGAILAGQFVGQQLLCGSVSGDFLIGQKRDEALLKGAKAAFDFAFGLRAGCDQMRDAQRREGTLELRAGIAAIAGGLMAEQGQAIGVESHGEAVVGKGPAEVLKMVPGSVGGDKDGGQEFA